MPAAAVIPALIVYTKIAAVKKLVVGFWDEPVYKWYFIGACCLFPSSEGARVLFVLGRVNSAMFRVLGVG